MDDVAEELMYGENGNSSHQDPNGVVEIKSENFIESNLHQSFPVCKSEQKQFKRSRENYGLKSITPEQYASRSAMLSSLVVAWSPALHLSSESGPASLCDSCHCGVLAVGGKSGKISFWRVPEPQCYSIEHGDVSVDSFLTGLLQAHNAWITAITWGVITFDSSKVFLATGSADGSVKIWLGDAMGLIKSSGIENASFSQLEEVITTGSPVSALSLSVPVESPDKILLAVGKGSGLLEAWIFQVSSSELQNVGSYIQHDKVVTGLSWAFDGRCLYSCSQDNSVRSWILRGSALHEVPFPSSSPCFEGSNDIPHAFDSCFGVTLSPGNLAAAVVRSFDVDLLDQMYEARTQKAAVQFFWTGGQQLEASSEKKLDENTESLPNISNSDLAYWEFNILWSLKLFENVCRPLVVWDVITALSAFKQSAPNCLQLMVFKWLSSLYLHCYPDLSTKNILLVAPSLLSKIESRKMHLLNIVCRRVVLAEVKADRLNGKQHDVESNEQLKPWIQLLLSSETELRVRIVVFTLLMVLSRASCSTKMPSISIHWHPSGVAQMEQWVAIHHGPVQDQLKLLKSKIGELGGRLNSICDYVTEEKCNFCSASVPFESPELAFCEGAECAQSHKLSRCMVCMKVCPTTPLWFCMCCQRRAFKLAPQVFFTMSRSPLDVRTYNWVSELQVKPKPLCPFCGVVLQRLLPEFLLSTSLV